MAKLAKAQKRTVAVAESLTGGLLTSKLAAASEASSWLRGGLVAYSSEVKFRLLGVRPGPVVSEVAAATMADSVAKLLEADTALAVTGVAGPGEQDGQQPGTVWVGLCIDGRVETMLLKLDRQGPEAICEAACDRSLELLVDSLSRNWG